MNGVREHLKERVETHALEQVIGHRDATILRQSDTIKRQDTLILELRSIVEAKERTIQRLRADITRLTTSHESLQSDKPPVEGPDAGAQ